MKLTYTPTGGEPQSWTVEPDELTSLEIEAVEDETGWTFGEWADRISRGSVKALHALLWVYLAKDAPGLAYRDVVFKPSEIDVSRDDEDPKD